jgi:excisionase family DNA binding protein
MERAFATIGTWTQMTGIGRTTTYGLLTDGKLRAVKAGGRTLIDVDHGLAWLRSQPTVKISIKRAA